MENDNINTQPDDVSDELRQHTDLDNMERNVGSDPTDLNSGLDKIELPTFGNPDKYGYDKNETIPDDKKMLEDEANAVVGSE